MKIIIGSLTLFLFTIGAFGTPQMEDVIYFKKNIFNLHSRPLYNIHSERDFKTFFEEEPLESSSCWRGYVATWKISDNRLYLLSIKECFGEQTAKLEKIFPNLYTNNVVPATWFTGELILRKSKWVKYNGMGDITGCRKEIIIKIEKGKVVSIKRKKHINKNGLPH